MIILGIETTCDDTGVAFYNSKLHKVIYNKVITQNHNVYGGVHVGVAPREHLKTLYQAFMEVSHLIDKVDLITYASHPGLNPCILIGQSFALGLGSSTNIDTLGVNHLHGHIYSPWLTNQEPIIPYLAMLVTGGHTQMYYVHGNDLKLVGTAIDDALGELIDKVARMLHLPYPGGPHIEQHALKGSNVYRLPKPMCSKGNCNFSFSGLKSHIKKICDQENIDSTFVANMSCSLQHTIFEILWYKLKASLTIFPEVKDVSFIGGVSANLFLRDQLVEKLRSQEIALHFAEMSYCTDNGAMIAYAGYRSLKS